MFASSTSSCTKAYPTAINSQITDAVTEVNDHLLGSASAVAMANQYQATAQALCNAAHHATAAQQQAHILAQAATAQGVALRDSLSTVAPGRANAKRHT
jgi:hypothetical protein